MKDSVYRAFGLNIHSEVPLPNLSQIKGTPDIVIRYGKVPDKIPHAKIKGTQYQVGPGEFLLRINGVARYHVKDGKTILIQKESQAVDEEMLLILMDSIMGVLLFQRNVLPLHSSAVAVNEEGVLFMGTSGIGKSTIVTGFQKKGFPFLADDLCAVKINRNGEPRIVPGFPQGKLWDDTLKKMNIDRTKLRRARLDSDLEKYFIPFDNSPDLHPPVRSIFVLNTSNIQDFESEEVKGFDKANLLINYTYRPWLLEGLGGKENHFKQCARVAEAARVIKVTRPDHGFKLKELMDIIQKNW